MYYNNLDPRTAREQINLSQIWQAWIEAEDMRRHSFLGTMGWERRNGADYLYRRIGKVAKSLGARLPETEARLENFKTGRARNAERLKSLGRELDRQAAILRGLGAGRVPQVAARVLREIRIHGKGAGLRVVGTNALHAYEALSGVVFEAGATATGDIDLLLDDRRRLKLLTEEREAIGLARLIRMRVDKTFETRGPRDFRLTNATGYMVELIRPLPRPLHRKMPGAAPFEAGDVEGAPIHGLQWLVNAPAVEALVVDERGYPAPMTCPDPRIWVAHKLWIAGLEDRDPVKKIRDRGQAEAVIRLIADRLPQYSFDAAFLARLPHALAAPLAPALAAVGGPERNGPAW